MADWRIGCSGFQYREWKDIFYPSGLPQTKYFEYYTTKFNCLELNSTFYHFPKISTLQKWYQRSPAGFKFSVKVPQVITHFKRFNECEEKITAFYNSLQEGLGDKLGTVLFQLPPSIIYSDAMLDKIIKNIDPAFHNVIEFRHASWWNAGVYKKLTEYGITFCGVSHPKMPEDIIVNNKLLYYRLHGVPTMFKSQYDAEYIKCLFKKLTAIKTVDHIYVLFNNTWGIAGINNAIELKAFQEVDD